MTNLNFTFVLPTYNRHSNVLQLLKELEPTKYKLEVIVVDDSEIPMTYPDWIIVDSNIGKRGAVNCINLGISKSTNDWIILCGDDVHIPDIKQFLTNLELSIFYSHNPIIGFHIIDKHPRHIPTILCDLAWWTFQYTYPETGNKPKYCRFTSAFAFDKSRVHQLFDSHFIGSGHYAESDFILSNNLKVFYNPDLKIYHDELGLTTNSKSDLSYNRKYFLNKHGYS